MKEYNPFPLGIAEDEAFCNRTNEQHRLNSNVQIGRHSILLAPRRFGKTSLALKVLNKNKYIYASADFLLAASEHSVETILLHAVGKLIGRLLPFHKRAIEKVRKFMDSLSPKFVINKEGPQIEFSPKKKSRQNIVETLEGLDHLARDQGKQVVLLFDEFQQIATLKNNKELEAAIRHAAERAKNTSYIFSGSNRHLLMEMFEDSARPLYHLCDQIILSRIQAQHYRSYIQKEAKRKWKMILSNEIIESILQFTECHPYYINVLCSRLWAHDKLPTNIVIEKEWISYAQEQRSRIVSELAVLSPNQRAIVNGLAQNPSTQLTSKAFLQEIELSSASAIQALKQLQEKDVVYRDEEGKLRLLDPIIQYFISQMDGN